MWRSHNSEALGMALLVERSAKNRRLNGRRGKTNFKKKVKKNRFLSENYQNLRRDQRQKQALLLPPVTGPEKRWNNKRSVKRRKTNREKQTGKALENPPCGPIMWALLQVTVCLNSSAL